MRNDGYTLVELVVVILIFTIVMAIISASFVKIVASSGQIVRSAETDIGGMIGLELFRCDLELAGFGLPWSLPDSFIYSEAGDQVFVNGCPDGCPNANASLFNDNSPTAAPRAYVLGDNVGYNGSDYLVLKGTAVGMSKTSRKWSYLNYTSVGVSIKPSKSEVELNLGSSERVIVIKNIPIGSEVTRELVTQEPGSSKFSLLFNNPIPAGFLPNSKVDSYLVYGVDVYNSADLSFPFNRADYYISRKQNDQNISSICADNTGILYKTVISQNSSIPGYYPLLDCVADMQVVTVMVPDSGDRQWYLSDKDIDAKKIRDMLQEIRIYILAQQGKKDVNYSYPVSDPSNVIQVGDRIWSQSDLSDKLCKDWRNYHWKVYTIAVQPKNL